MATDNKIANLTCFVLLTAALLGFLTAVFVPNSKSLLGCPAPGLLLDAPTVEADWLGGSCVHFPKVAS